MWNSPCVSWWTSSWAWAICVSWQQRRPQHVGWMRTSRTRRCREGIIPQHLTLIWLQLNTAFRFAPSPHPRCHTMKINKPEQVQGRVTRIAGAAQPAPCAEKLGELNLFSLVKGQLWGQLTEASTGHQDRAKLSRVACGIGEMTGISRNKRRSEGTGCTSSILECFRESTGYIHERPCMPP